jgi:hypothetical protein
VPPNGPFGRSAILHVRTPPPGRTTGPWPDRRPNCGFRADGSSIERDPRPGDVGAHHAALASRLPARCRIRHRGASWIHDELSRSPVHRRHHHDQGRRCSHQPGDVDGDRRRGACERRADSRDTRLDEVQGDLAGCRGGGQAAPGQVRISRGRPCLAWPLRQRRDGRRHKVAVGADERPRTSRQPHPPAGPDPSSASRRRRRSRRWSMTRWFAEPPDEDAPRTATRSSPITAWWDKQLYYPDTAVPVTRYMSPERRRRGDRLRRAVRTVSAPRCGAR